MDPPPEPQRDERCCLRIGVINPRAPLTKEQVLDEMDSIKMSSFVNHVAVEGVATNHHRDGILVCFARVYFETPADADAAIVEFNAPYRTCKWKQFVTQRLPLPGPLSGEIGSQPTFEAFVEDPADTVIVDTQEGYTFFSTDELYRTRGLEEYITTKKNGRVIRRLICKHYDAERRIACRFGFQCSFLHVKAFAQNRLLRTVGSWRTPLRIPRHEEDVQLSCWEFERRQDTLVVRDLEPNVQERELAYMFGGCSGYLSSAVRRVPHSTEAHYGIVRFQSRAHAWSALVQTFGSGLSISFWGAIEDLRTVMANDARERGAGAGTNLNVTLTGAGVLEAGPTPAAAAAGRAATGGIDLRQSGQKRDRDTRGGRAGGSMKEAAGYDDSDDERGKEPARKGPPAVGTDAPQTDAPADATPTPFPPLPDGWSYGFSKRTGKYFFFMRCSMDKTTWKHPSTQACYNAEGVVA